MNARDLSPEAQFAFAVFQVKEKRRHQKDILAIDIDLENLRQMGVDVDKAEEFDMPFVTTEMGFV